MLQPSQACCEQCHAPEQQFNTWQPWQHFARPIACKRNVTTAFRSGSSFALARAWTMATEYTTSHANPIQHKHLVTERVHSCRYCLRTTTEPYLLANWSHKILKAAGCKTPSMERIACMLQPSGAVPYAPMISAEAKMQRTTTLYIYNTSKQQSCVILAAKASAVQEMNVAAKTSWIIGPHSITFNAQPELEPHLHRHFLTQQPKCT